MHMLKQQPQNVKTANILESLLKRPFKIELIVTFQVRFKTSLFEIHYNMNVIK